jgi:hypothetical protein
MTVERKKEYKLVRKAKAMYKEFKMKETKKGNLKTKDSIHTAAT